MCRRPKASNLPGCLLLCLPFLIIEAVTQDTWNVNYTPRKFCSLRGSSLTMRCKYTAPIGHNVTRLLWFSHHRPHVEPRDLTADPQFKGRVQYFFDDHNCTVRITDLMLNDSGTYSFMFTTDRNSHTLVGHPGVSLNVTDLGVRLDSHLVVEGDWPLFTCGSCSLSDNPIYTWFKDKRPLTPWTKLPVAPNALLIESALHSHSGNYSCSVQNKEADHNLGVTLKVGYLPRKTKALLYGEAVEGGSANLSCSSEADPPAEYTWYKESTPSAISSGQNHTINNISSEDVGRYYCEARNIYGKVNSKLVEIKGEYVLLWAPAVVGGALLVAAALLILLYCSRQKSTVGRGAAVDKAPGAPADDTYTTLDIKPRSPDYDTLENVKWNCELNTTFEERSTADKQSSSDYENTLS